MEATTATSIYDIPVTTIDGTARENGDSIAETLVEQAMNNEIDNALEAEVARRAKERGIQTDVAADRPRAARLASRLYAGASALQRSRMLTNLLRPLGPLAIAGVASGAFAGLLGRVGSGAAVTIDDIGNFTQEQVFELARFVEQVSPSALHEAVKSVSENPFGLSAFGAAAAALLSMALRGNGRRLRAQAPLPAPDDTAQPDRR